MLDTSLIEHMSEAGPASGTGRIKGYEGLEVGLQDLKVYCFQVFGALWFGPRVPEFGVLDWGALLGFALGVPMARLDVQIRPQQTSGPGCITRT